MPISPSDDVVTKDADEGKRIGRGREETDEESAKRRKFMEEVEGDEEREDVKDEECEAEEDLEAGEEEVKQKEVRQPGQPTKMEKESHELTHYPFRSWCKHCVRGKGKESPHKKKKEKGDKDVDEEVPEIHVDYCFQSKDDSAGAVTTLVMREKPSGSTASIVSLHKGRQEHVVKRIIEKINQWGNEKVKIIVRSDGEPAIKALVRMVQASRELEYTVQTGGTVGGTIVEEAPKNDSQSMGIAERAVQEVEGNVRTWLSHLEEKLGSPVKGNSPMIIWLIEHVSSIMNRSKVGPDGKTPHARTRGKESKTKHVPFGEKVLWMVSKERRRKDPKMSPRFYYGAFVGINEVTGEYLLLTPDGLERARTIRRLPEEDKWDMIFVNSCKGTPWDFEGKQVIEDLSETLSMPEIDKEKEVDLAEGGKFQRMRITQADINEHGPTRGCGGCRALALKLKSQTHSERCRERMIKLIAKSPQGATRIQVAEEKETELLAEKLERDIQKSESKERKEEDEMHAEEAEVEVDGKDRRARSSDEPNEERAKKKVRVDTSENLQVKVGTSADEAEEERAKKKQRTDGEKEEEPVIMYVNQGKNDKEKQRTWNKIVKDNPDMIVGRIKKSSNPDVNEFYADMYKYQMKRGKYFAHEDTVDRKFSRSVVANKIIMNKKTQQFGGNWCGPGKPSINLIANSSILADKMKEANADLRMGRGTGNFEKLIRNETRKQVEADKEFEINIIEAMIADQEDGGDEADHKETIGAQAFHDHVNGGELDPKKVRKARREEMAYFKKMHVYDKVDRSVCAASKKKPIGVRWVDTVKSDGSYRSRLVAKEFKTNNNPGFFSATPPTESLKMILSLVAAAQGHRRDNWGPVGKCENKYMKDANDDNSICLLYTDISRAYFHAEAREEKYVEIPDEDWEEGDNDRCARLRVSMYGTRDAAANWEACYGKVLVDNGFVRGRASPCLYYNKDRSLRLYVHGDDFVCAGPLCQLRWTTDILDTAFEAKHQVMGASDHLMKELKILNRKVSWKSQGITIEADPKHVRVLLEEMNLELAKVAKTPATREEGAKGSRDKNDDEDDEADVDEFEIENKKKDDEAPEIEASKGDSFQYRSWAARLNYLAMDRADIQFAVKACAKAMSNPQPGDFVKIKRLVRYLKHRVSLVIEFVWQDWPEHITMYTDSDWAGDRATRKSTSGGAMMFGSHAVKSWSKDQSVIALSSGEAELYAANMGGIQSLGMKSFLQDVGVKMKIRILIDAKATLGIIGRQGLGKVRHIAVQDLWLQEKVKSKAIVMEKVASKENIADLMTKPLTAEEINEHVIRLGCSF